MPPKHRDEYEARFAKAAFHELHRSGWRCRLGWHKWQFNLWDGDRYIYSCDRCGRMRLAGSWSPHDWLRDDELPFWPPPADGITTLHEDGQIEYPDRIVHLDNTVDWK